MTGKAAFGAEDLAFQFGEGARQFWLGYNSMVPEFTRWFAAPDDLFADRAYATFLVEMAAFISSWTNAALNAWFAFILFMCGAIDRDETRQECN